MKGWWAVAGCAALMSSALACGDPTFVCTEAQDCGADGVCEANGGCSFPDPDCESGRRFAARTPSANECVPPEEGTSSTTSGDAPTTIDTLEPTSDSSSSTAPDDGTTTTDGSSSSSDIVPITTADTSSSSGAEESSSSGGSFAFDVFDDFERPDSEDIGNGWAEKTPEAFSLIDGGIRRVGPMEPYPENYVYRPDDTWTDAEAIVELEWFTVDKNLGSPQIGLRTQLEDLLDPGSVTCYLLFVNGSSGNVTITRQIAGSFSREWIAPMTAPVTAGPRYRLRINVSGSDEVLIDGYLEEWVEGEWTLHTELHAVDDDAERLTTPGTLAIGGHREVGVWTYESVSLESFDP